MVAMVKSPKRGSSNLWESIIGICRFECAFLDGSHRACLATSSKRATTAFSLMTYIVYDSSSTTVAL